MKTKNGKVKQYKNEKERKEKKIIYIEEMRCERINVLLAQCLLIYIPTAHEAHLFYSLKTNNKLQFVIRDVRD